MTVPTCTCPVFPLSDTHRDDCPTLAVVRGRPCGVCGVTVWLDRGDWQDATGSLGVRGPHGHRHQP